MPLPTLKEQFSALLGIESVSCTQASLDRSNKGVIELLASWLGELGFAIEIQEVKPGKFNLIASFGHGEGGLVLAGHTDTVPFDEALWQSNPLTLTERDNRWYGLGSCDMKGFFALVIEAVKALCDQPFKAPLIILATCDEESSMSGARAIADSGRTLGRAAIIGEPTGLKPIRLHKGVMMERIDIVGQSGHSSDPSLGQSALEAMHEVMAELIALRNVWQAQYHNPQFTVPTPTLNLGCIHGGDNPNRICGQCALEFDLRPLPGMDPDELRAIIQAKLNPIAAAHQVEIGFAPLFESLPAFAQDKDAELVKLAEKLTGTDAQAVAFGTEAPYLQKAGCQTIVLGPGDIRHAHQPNEHLDLAYIKPTVALLTQFIEHYCLKSA